MKIRKLNWEQVEEIRELRKNDFTIKRLSELFDVSVMTIHKIIKNKTYKTELYRWDDPNRFLIRN